MGLRDRMRYFYALVTTLPFGILALFYGMQGLVGKTDLSSLKMVSGNIVFSGTKQVYSKIVRAKDDAFVIVVKDKTLTVECNTSVTVDMEKLKVLEGKDGEKVTVWFDPELENQIEQVEYENKIILQYQAPYILFLSFILLGVIFILGTLIYLYNNYKEV